MEFTVKDIAMMIGGSVEGDRNEKITSFGKIQEAQKGDISFLANPKYEPHLYQTQASAVIINDSFAPSQPISTTLIKVEDAYAAFTKLLEEYDKLTKAKLVGIEQPSFIHESSNTGNNFYLGAFSRIAANVSIGNNTKIHSQADIGLGSKIGDNCIIYSGVKIYPNTVIGDNCIIHANTVVGSDGFGFAPLKDGSYKKIPQLGNVVLEDNVEIGANATIDCGTMGSTVVKKGVKLDNLVQIAHNVIIGENTVIAAQSGVSGSTEVGTQCVIGGQVGISGHLKIADGVQMGAKSGVTKANVAGEKIMGYPAFNLRNFQRSQAIIRKLPQLVERLYALEKKDDE